MADHLTAATAATTTFPVYRGQYKGGPVDDFKAQTVAALAALEEKLQEAERRATAAEGQVNELVERGGGDPFKGAQALIEQQARAQAEIDDYVANCNRYCQGVLANADRHAAEVVAQAERQTAVMLADAARTAGAVSGEPHVQEPPVTGDQMTDAINLAEYVRVARRAHTDHSAAVLASLDKRLTEALELLDAADARSAEVRAALEAVRRPGP